MHLEWLDSELIDSKTVTCTFEDAVEAAVMRPSIEGELWGESRRQFTEDIAEAREDTSHEIRIEVLAHRISGPVVRHLRRRANRFGRRAVVDYDNPEIDRDPSNPVVEHRVEAQLVTILADEIDYFFNQSTAAP